MGITIHGGHNVNSLVLKHLKVPNFKQLGCCGAWSHVMSLREFSSEKNGMGLVIGIVMG